MRAFCLCLVSAITLAACGDTDLERATTGGATGAAVALITNGNPVRGAVIGTAAGALCDDFKICPGR